MYRPASALADYTEIMRHWHADVGYRSRALPHPPAPADVPDAPRGYFVEAVKA
jgi:hypothetical protein